MDFRNVIIVLTSNLGAHHLAELKEGDSAESVREEVMEDVRAAFRPEFLNRLDEITLFNRLGRSVIRSIVDIQLARLQSRLDERKVTLDIDDKAKDWIAGAGYDPIYGARPLKRVIQRSLENRLATLLLDGSVGENESITITADEDGLLIGG